MPYFLKQHQPRRLKPGRSMAQTPPHSRLGTSCAVMCSGFRFFSEERRALKIPGVQELAGRASASAFGFRAFRGPELQEQGALRSCAPKVQKKKKSTLKESGDFGFLGFGVFGLFWGNWVFGLWNLWVLGCWVFGFWGLWGLGFKALKDHL